MNYFLIISLIINILLLLLFYLIYKNGYSIKCEDYPIYNKILLSRILKIAKGGDLLLFSNSRCNVVTRTFGNPYYSHIGIIIKKNNKLYTLELVKDDNVYPKQNRYKGLIIIPLEDRILHYSGSVYYCQLINPLDQDLENKLLNISNTKVNYNIFNACSFYIAKILEELKISKNLVTWKLWEIHNNIINLCNNSIYNNPILIIQDKLLINDVNKNSIMNYC
jgi:hypothetical protein